MYSASMIFGEYSFVEKILHGQIIFATRKHGPSCFGPGPPISGNYGRGFPEGNLLQNFTENQ